MCIRDRPEWRESVIKVRDFIEPSPNMTISFVLSSDSFESIAEAGVDNFKVFDAGTVSVRDFIQEELDLSIAPNPFDQQLTIQYEASQWQEIPNVVLFDALGKTVIQQPMPLNQQVSIPSTLQSGIYFLQLRTAEKGSRVMKMIKN